MIPAGLSVVRVGELLLPDSGWAVEADGLAVDRGTRRVYVLDELGPRLLVFSEDGAFVRQIGRPGEGPGEYSMPVALDVDGLGVLKVVDGARSLLLSWDQEGRFLGQRHLAVPYWGPGLRAEDDDLVYVQGVQSEGSGGVTETLVRSGGGSVTGLASLEQPWVPASLPCGAMSVPRAMAPSIVWGGNERYVVAAAWPDYVLQVFEDGALAASLRRDIPPFRVSEEAAASTVPDGALSFLLQSCGMTVPEVLHATGYVELASPIDRIVVDPSSRIWTRTNSVMGDGTLVDILDVERGYLGSLSTPVFPVVFITANRFLAIADRPWGSAVEIWEVRTADE
ncbi:MAG TPA: 6-bladed beta-propeller [Longimicrobiales bacterium]|nr:6-bladed beta-propeller [Longimicrobiales bacterium]